MPTSIGKVKKVNPREIWKKESPDFTNWLAANIDYLNDALDTDITVQTVEGNVGPYRVDIYGEDGAGNRVIIENQLEKSDHTHLGQLLTYLVNLGAKVAIWITTKPTEEHQQVIEWLNETSPDDMRFYLVQIEAIRIDGQESVGPLFTLVEGPTEERKSIGAEKKDSARRHVVRERFWAQFIDKINEVSSICENVSPSSETWIGTKLGMSGVGLNFVATGTYARAEVYINRGDVDENKKFFDFFLERKDEIEKAFGGPLIWERMDDRVTSRIKAEKDGLNIFDEADWGKMHEYMIDVGLRMHAAFKGPVQKLRSTR